MRICKHENCENPVFGQGFCKFHYPRKPIKKITEKGMIKKQEKKEKSKELHQWFLDLWDKRADKNGNVTCYESDTLLSYTIFKHNSCCYSHYLPKSKYPQYALEEWNLEIVHPDIHSLWESDATKCKKMYRRYSKLKEKYG